MEVTEPIQCMHKVNDSCIKVAKAHGSNVQCYKCGASLSLEFFVNQPKAESKTGWAKKDKTKKDMPPGEAT